MNWILYKKIWLECDQYCTNWIQLRIFHSAYQLKKDQLGEARIKDRPLGRPRCRWEESIIIDLKQGGIVGTG
jgi:hypothetical protein